MDTSDFARRRQRQWPFSRPDLRADLDVVYIQAKRYAPGNTIGREQIQQFTGALVGQGALRGVFFTTSSFTRPAIEYAERVTQRVILIDGNRLTQLMMQYGVGVRVDRSVEIRRVDLDYFVQDQNYACDISAQMVNLSRRIAWHR